MMMDVAVGIAVFLIVISLLAYVVLMIFFPEWVGITGKSAKKTLEEHKEGSHAEDSEWFRKAPKR